ncbi:MAG: DUF4424 family protein [Acidobacteriaceae bacterium]
MRKALLLALTLTVTLPLHADDGAASIAAGGIVLMKREPRITMAKEVLQISPSKVIVDYDFRNDSDQAITTEVAFPVPAYTFGEDNTVFGDPAFKNFKLSMDNQPARYSLEVRAYVNHRDITALLAREHINAATFGHWDAQVHDYAQEAPDFHRASHTSRQKLIAAGAFKDGEPMWRVEKKYHWTQTFPAHSTIHIRHEYTPVLGGTNSVLYGLEAERLPKTQRTDDSKEIAAEIQSLCLEPSLNKSLLDLSHRSDMSIPFNYVDFILTTANTWKTPIEDFTLIVDRPAPNKSTVSKKPESPRQNETLVSFCWNGPIKKTDSTHFTAHATNFIPTKELRIGFIYANQTDPQTF